MATPTRAIEDKPNGPVAAVLLAGGLGSAVMGLVTVLSEVSKGAYGPLLNWYNPVGPLTGKSIIATASFFLAWALLHLVWRGKGVNFGVVAILALALLAVGLLGTFPPVFAMFAGN